MKTLNYISATALVLSVAGCSSVNVKEYSHDLPTLQLETYLNGTLDAYGIFKDRAGRVKKRFHCLIQASWREGVGTMDEKFDYSDGTHSQRVWTLRKQADGKYIGTAADVVGQATGEVAGNTFRWNYVLDLDVDGSHYQVNFDDWMYLMDERVMLNHSKMSKWGVALGEVILSFYKRADAGPERVR